MKKNFKSIMVAALALTAGLVGCTKEAGNTEDAETRYVFLRVEQPGLDGTRATGSTIADNTPVTFTDGYVFFTDASGKILNRYTIVSGTGDENGGNVGLTTLTSTGANFPAVKSTASQVYIIGNANGATMPAVNDNIHTGLAAATATATIASQFNSGDVTKVSLYGTNIISYSGTIYSSNVSISAISSRFEIGAIKATGDISGFTLDGIFINKYYEKMGFNGIYTTGGTANAATFYDANHVRNNFDVAANYSAVGGSYNGTVAGTVYDAPSTAHTALQVKPASGVWAYNLLAPTTTGQTPQMNSIVIKLSNITVSTGDQSYYTGKTFFLTINNFYDNPTPDPLKVINNLKNGTVYQIAEVEFDENDLSLEPEKKTKAVSVKAITIPWKAKSISYDFD